MCVRAGPRLCVSKRALSPAKIIACDVKIKAEGEANYRNLPWAPALCFKVRLVPFSLVLLQFYTSCFSQQYCQILLQTNGSYLCFQVELELGSALQVCASSVLPSQRI